jgi:hypothetical protein
MFFVSTGIMEIAKGSLYSTNYWGIYFFYWIPIIPTCSLIVNLADPAPCQSFDTSTGKLAYENPSNCGLLKAHVIPDAISWSALILLIPFWFLAYMYFDSVIPNTYGIAKHPCFCFKKGNRVDKESLKKQLIYNDNSVFNHNDPIRIEGLEKTFGKLKAVKDLTFSIK